MLRAVRRNDSDTAHCGGPRLVSRPGVGVKGDRLRQFFCINGRPVELPKAVKALNETYK